MKMAQNRLLQRKKLQRRRLKGRRTVMMEKQTKRRENRNLLRNARQQRLQKTAMQNQKLLLKSVGRKLLRIKQPRNRMMLKHPHQPQQRNLQRNPTQSKLMNLLRNPQSQKLRVFLRMILLLLPLRNGAETQK